MSKMKKELILSWILKDSFWFDETQCVLSEWIDILGVWKHEETVSVFSISRAKFGRFPNNLFFYAVK